METLTAVYDRRSVCFACLRVPPSQRRNRHNWMAFDVATRGNIKGISTGTSLPLMEGGQYRALAKDSKQPLPILPDLPSKDKPTPKLNRTLPFRERLGCSPSEACVALGVGRTFLYQLIAERRVEVTKLGRRTIISISSLLKLLDSQTAEPRPRRRGRSRQTNAAGGAS